MPVKVRFITPVALGGKKVRYPDNGLIKKQEAMMKALEQQTMQAVQDNIEKMLTLTQARERVADYGKSVDAFNVALEAGEIARANKQGIRWFIPQSSVDEWVAGS